MNRFACIFVAVGLAAGASTALAQPAKAQPTVMSDAQMDDVTAGDLTIVIQDSFNNWIIAAGGKKPHPGNGNAKGLEQGAGNPHRNASSGVPVVVVVNIIGTEATTAVASLR
jgi:hypothetical protein